MTSDSKFGATSSRRTDSQDDRLRAQANVVGVALLLGVVVIALGSLTASVGTVVEQNAASADASRVAADFDRSLAPVEATGTNRGRVSFTEGSLRTEERELRVLNSSGILRTVAVDALVFTSDERRVAFLAGAVVRGRPGNAWVRSPAPITASRAGGANGVLVVGAPKLGGSVAVSGSGGTSFLLETNVSHRRANLGNDTFRIAVETETPGAWERHFQNQNATTTTRDLDSDGVVSVIARFPGHRIGYLVVHEMRLEVQHG